LSNFLLLLTKSSILNKKKHKLSVSMEENYCLLGISSDEPDYKLCWLINNQLRMSFVKTDNLQVFHKKLDIEQEFSMFHFEDDNAMLEYRLISNRSDAGYFLSDLKNIDYILHIQGDLINDNLSAFVLDLNSIETIRLCVPVDLKKVREKDRLQLW